MIGVLDGNRAVLGPVGILRLHREMAERGEPGGNLCPGRREDPVEAEPGRGLGMARAGWVLRP